jgi:hypothetical protein
MALSGTKDDFGRLWPATAHEELHTVAKLSVRNKSHNKSGTLTCGKDDSENGNIKVDRQNINKVEDLKMEQKDQK